MHRIVWGLIALAAATLPLAAPPAAAEGGRSFTITAGGDILIHRTIAQIADDHAPGAGVYDFTPMLRPIEPWVGEADLAICHLEGALDPENTGLSYYPLFNAPHEVADALATVGYDACSTAGNHTLDHGFTGLADTLAILDAAGIRHAGSARSAGERLPSLYEVNGVIVGHLAYTYGANGLRPPGDKPWAVNFIGDGDGILEDARWARQHGAEFVVVSMHWGTEYQTPPTAGQTALAERLLASPDIDLILGTHVHVVQPIGRVGGEVVVYGMGNQISNMRAFDGHSGTEDGILVHLEIRETGGRFAVTSVTYTPTWVHPTTKAVLPVAHTLAYEPDDYRWELEASLTRSVSRVTLLDAPGIGLSPTPWPALLCQGRLATTLGTAGDDRLVGTPGPDVVATRGGDDFVEGGAGDDLICAGPGDDQVLGGLGRDTVYGGTGDDRLRGMQDDDRLHGEAGNDYLAGETGDDLLVGADGFDRLEGGPGDDVLGGGAGADVLLGADGADLLFGADGDDLLFGGPGDDRLHGGPGRDSLYGGDDADALFGGPDVDLLFGGPGDDELSGGDGADQLSGGAGNDTCRDGTVQHCCEA
ncbi:MAG TPA: CapA family protein [Acidimicrobiia bacterium]|nr:CapA family protein [Acidimicrobiia bacterium]